MPKKVVVKRIVDFIMTFLLLFLMGYQFWGQLAHEWAGVIMFVCFILHHILNRNWYTSLKKGKCTSTRVIWIILNILLFAAMIGLMISGIMLSRHAFAFLSIKGSMSFARRLHMVSAYWGFLLMALHIGFHWVMLWNPIKAKIKNSRLLFLLKTAGWVFAVYGIYVFVKRNLIQYLFLKTEFVFMDFSESKVLFYLDYLSMIAMFILAATLIKKVFGSRGGK